VQLNYLFSNARETDGYGRYNNRLIKALRKLGATVRPQLTEMANAPGWLQAEMGLDWNDLTISCLPPFYLNTVPGPHWLLTMTEGSALPGGWGETILESGVERIIVPCQHNADVFSELGLPVHVIPGGTDPDEFRPGRICADPHPYTFLAIADRGARKGWGEVWGAFYKAFGRPEDTPDVRLIIKALPDHGNDVLTAVATAENPDPRITFLFEEIDNIVDFYRMGDCLAIPSRSEGFGMPHREAAACGLPVITQKYSGMDDGFTHKWATVVRGGQLENIPQICEHVAGQWLRCDVHHLAHEMMWHYMNPEQGRWMGREASKWLAANQTWLHSADRLLRLIEEHHGADR